MESFLWLILEREGGRGGERKGSKRRKEKGRRWRRREERRGGEGRGGEGRRELFWKSFYFL